MRARARKVVVSPSVRGQLEKLAARHRAEQRDVLRARIVLFAAKGVANEEIARRLGCTTKTVQKWRGRFAAHGRIKALQDEPRKGRPARVTVEERAELVKLACERPDGSKVAFRNFWTYQSLADVFRATCDVTLSESEVGRILRGSDLRPHHARPWLHSPDPEFRQKTRAVCGLYLSPPPGAHVVCVDEKTGIQALQRRFSGHPAGPRRAAREEFEYKRHGTTTMIAAFDVRTGSVHAECGPTRTADDLLGFMERLAIRYPTGQIHVVWDNLNTHTGERWVLFNARHGNRFHFMFTPKHASWLNQIEVWFGILHRRVLKRASFASLEGLLHALSGFVAHWNRYEKHPFQWKFRGRFARRDVDLAA